MARTASIRDETILKAALEVFLSRGIQATTAEVAERAGVSEGTIFNRFKTKDELFRAAMMSSGGHMPWVASLEGRVGKGKMRDQMIEIGHQVVDFFRVLMPLMMMNWSNRGTHGAPPMLSEENPPPAVAIRKLTAYFEAEARAGRIRKTNAAALARTFVGGLQSFVFFEVLLKGREPTLLTAEEFVRGHVGVIWSGIAPEG